MAAANVVSKSFLWFGAWSFLTLKSWAYLLLEIPSAIGAFYATRLKQLAPVWAIVLSHLAAMTYGVVVYYAVHRMGNLPGWYLWPMAAPLALLLAAVGLYGVTSNLVSLRTQEIGVRMALGAGAREVRAMVVGHALKLALAPDERVDLAR